jgi:hypothetical protein
VGFRPAFFDYATFAIYLSRYHDGRLAPMHRLDGLPDGVACRPSLLAGFERKGFFYTRAAAARATAEWALDSAD